MCYDSFWAYLLHATCGLVGTDDVVQNIKPWRRSKLVAALGGPVSAVRVDVESSRHSDGVELALTRRAAAR